jgi:DNA topoisomerase-3
MIAKLTEIHFSAAQPVPLATVELQKRASRWLHMTSKQAMDVAEALYQKGFISYPRTETEVFKEGTDLSALRCVVSLSRL